MDRARGGGGGGGTGWRCGHSACRPPPVSPRRHLRLLPLLYLLLGAPPNIQARVHIGVAEKVHTHHRHIRCLPCRPVRCLPCRSRVGPASPNRYRREGHQRSERSPQRAMHCRGQPLVRVQIGMHAVDGGGAFGRRAAQPLARFVAERDEQSARVATLTKPADDLSAAPPAAALPTPTLSPCPHSLAYLQSRMRSSRSLVFLKPPMNSRLAESPKWNHKCHNRHRTQHRPGLPTPGPHGRAD
eukprot:scaffold16043_cov115-Isochrysis_galbana.AAC.5